MEIGVSERQSVKPVISNRLECETSDPSNPQTILHLPDKPANTDSVTPPFTDSNRLAALILPPISLNTDHILFLVLQVSNMFIVSLAIADLTVGLIVMPVSAIYIFTKDWLFGVAVCQFWIGVDYTASTASILNLFILSMDRYWSVTMPLKYLRKRTKKRALIMISLVWFASSLWLIPIIGWHHFEHSGVRTVPNHVCDTEYATNTALKILTGILNFYLPLAIMYALYTKIFIEIRRRSKLELGMRVSGGGGHAEVGMTTSLSDDSDDRHTSGKVSTSDAAVGKHTVIANCCAGMQDPNSIPAEHQQLMLARSTECETETEGTDEDISWQHKGGYTNLTLIRVARDSNRDHESPCYVYDESVCDSKTEQLHRYFYEEHPLTTIRRLTGGVGDSNQEHETNLQSPPDTPNLNTKVRFQVHNSVSRSPTKLPKESHPAKNQYVKPPRSCLPGQTSESDGNGGGNLEQESAMDSDTQTKDVVIANSPTIASNSCSHNTMTNSQPSIVISTPMGRTHYVSNSNGQQQQHNNVGSRHQNIRKKHAANSALVQQAVRWKKKLDKKKHRPSSALNKEIKAARQLGVIMGAFTVCFLPYFVCFMVVAFCGACVSLDLMTTVTWIGYLNSTLNPLLYPLCNQTFRRKFRQMLRLSGDDSRRQGSFYYSAKQTNSTAAYVNY